jgi:hypothetical protein
MFGNAISQSASSKRASSAAMAAMQNTGWDAQCNAGHKKTVCRQPSLQWCLPHPAGVA